MTKKHDFEWEKGSKYAVLGGIYSLCRCPNPQLCPLENPASPEHKMVKKGSKNVIFRGFSGTPPTFATFRKKSLSRLSQNFGQKRVLGPPRAEGGVCRIPHSPEMCVFWGFWGFFGVFSEVATVDYRSKITASIFD